MADLLSDVADPIGADSRVMKEGGALRARVALENRLKLLNRT
jgi:hypothetical protein